MNYYFDGCIVHIIVSVVEIHDASNREHYDGNYQRKYSEFLILCSFQYDEELYVGSIQTNISTNLYIPRNHFGMLSLHSYPQIISKMNL